MSEAEPLPGTADHRDEPCSPIPRSAIAGIEWPALPNLWQAEVLSLLFQFERSQWWSPEALLAHQYRQLAHLVRHAASTVPFYRERLAGLRPFEPPLAVAAWRALPVLTRVEIQEAGDALLSAAVAKSHGPISEIFTSGSTGRPLRARRTALSLAFWSAFTERDHLWHARDRSAKLAVVRHADPGRDQYPAGSRERNWTHEFRAVFATGPAVALNVNASVEEQLEWLARERPRYLLTFPTNALRLARYCLDEGVRLAGIEQVMLIGEIAGPGVRAACREAWGASVADIYSAREIGYIALQCPEAECLHVQSEGVLVEVLDDAGEACAPGTVGRIVVTPLHNFAMPLIRYEIGDYAEVGDPCRCGRGLPVLRRVLGREQDMLVLPSGERRWTLLSSGNIEGLLELAPIRQYQFAQVAPDAIEARLAVARPLSPAEEGAVRSWLIAKLGHPFAVTFAYPDAIPRTKGGKYLDFVSEI